MISSSLVSTKLTHLFTTAAPPKSIQIAALGVHAPWKGDGPPDYWSANRYHIGGVINCKMKQTFHD